MAISTKHLGRFRPVTKEQAKLDKLVLRTLFRRGTMAEGLLANWCDSTIATPEWQTMLVRLTEWRMLEAVSKPWGNTRTIVLLPEGTGWAMELLCASQMEEQDEEARLKRQRLDTEQREIRVARGE